MLGAEQAQQFTARIRQALQEVPPQPNILFLVGNGNNGKSYLIHNLKARFPEKVEQVPHNFLAISTGALVTVQKKVYFMELGDAGVNPDVLKEVSAQMPAPSVLIVMCNALPEFNPEDAGVWRRFQAFGCINQGQYGDIEAFLNQLL